MSRVDDDFCTVRRPPGFVAEVAHLGAADVILGTAPEEMWHLDDVVLARDGLHRLVLGAKGGGSVVVERRVQSPIREPFEPGATTRFSGIGHDGDLFVLLDKVTRPAFLAHRFQPELWFGGVEQSPHGVEVGI